MLIYDGIEYKLCLLDTNSLSEILKNHHNERTIFFQKFVPKHHIPCITIWTILEIRKSEILYNSFLQIFSIIPFCLLKPYMELLDEEIKNYPDPSTIDPILYTFTPFRDADQQIRTILNNIFSQSKVQDAEEAWDLSWRQEVLDSIQSLKSNFQPKGKFYNANDSMRFIKDGIPQYLSARKPEWLKEIISMKDSQLDINAFPSVKMIFYTVFYRFYAEKRDPELGDIFDLMISCILPYIDSTIIEKFQAEILNKVSRRDSFLTNLEVYTLKDLR